METVGGPRRQPPAKIVSEKLCQAARGHDVRQAQDTIGRLWCWGFLDGHQRHEGGRLREAGRIYARQYWAYYGLTASSGSASFQEMVGGSIPAIVIPDPEADERFAYRFRMLDAELGNALSSERRMVFRYCVQGHGVDDPAWLTGMMTGWSVETAGLRDNVASLAVLAASKDKALREGAKRKLHRAQAELADAVQQLNRLWQQPQEMACLRLGLGFLCDKIPEKVLQGER